MTTAPVHLDESLSTLRFGQLCKLIKNAAQENVQMTDKMVAAPLQQEVSDLKQELSRVKSAVAEHGGEDFANLVEGHETSAFAVVAKREREHRELERALHHATKKRRRARALEGREATCVEREHTVKRNLKRVALELDATRVERDAARAAADSGREVDARDANAAAGALLGEAMMKHAMATIEANRAKDARAELLAREEACESFCGARGPRGRSRRGSRTWSGGSRGSATSRTASASSWRRRRTCWRGAGAWRRSSRRSGTRRALQLKNTDDGVLGEQLEAAKASHRDLKAARAALDKADETRDAAAAAARPPPRRTERASRRKLQRAPGQEKGALDDARREAEGALAQRPPATIDEHGAVAALLDLRPPEVPATPSSGRCRCPRTSARAASDGDAPGEARPPPPKARLWGKLRDAVASPKASPTKSLFDVVRRSLSPPASPASSPVGPGGLANVSGESRAAAGGDGEATDDDDPPPAPVVAAPPPPPLEDRQVSRVPVAPGRVPVVHLRL
ncbi:hypothetical protein SO694_00066054 [Aureococcus anophagefferens]|uniref:Kinesin motor domain-containing protein n=1 Tax=Aureococcus anophagefferens TaxID=44056 RepID=A0ABR1FQ92_AURAN